MSEAEQKEPEGIALHVDWHILKAQQTDIKQCACASWSV